MTYTVHQLAKLAGVTPRTLRFYDSEGLLSPARQEKNGYRLYGADDLVRLQQILFFRELDFPISDIKAMLHRPGFDVVESLRGQKKLLKLKQKRIGDLIQTIDKTITAMTNEQQLDERDIYGGLSTEEIDAYKKEAKERWGHTDAYKQSQERVKKFTKDDWKRMSEETDATMKVLVALMTTGQEPASAQVQAQVARHHAGIEKFYDCAPAMYRSLGDGYLADQRFADFYRKYHADLPEFLVAGIHAWCDAKEKERGAA